MRFAPLNIVSIAYLLIACESGEKKLFTKLDKGATGIDFRNLLVESESLNVAHYLYFYNGSGVALGDINNDSLVDVFFTGNMVKNRLYLNKGDFSFENITDGSHVAEKQGWCTGATMVDINQDGWLDIYVCRSADDDPARRKNLLFVNNRDLSFTESAEQYGLADSGYSTQASFFDYDKDGDLDCFVLNHSVSKYSVGVTENPELRRIKDPNYESRLYKNDGGRYTNVSDAAGITSNVLSFGLGVATSDFNNDGWPDIYVSNDFKESDYLFLNNGDGTFTESFGKCMDVASLNSMGSDAADYNNDGYTDLVTLDMLAEDNYLQKTHAGPHNFDKTNLLISRGFHPQYMRNMLHRNNGDGTFSEIGQIAGISNTDWSWSALLCDYDGDGNKDLFISNGFVKDFSDLDFINYSTDRLMKARQGGEAGSFEEGVAKMPTIKIPNYIYQNDSSGLFTNKTEEWGLNTPAISSGAAYADLDNDGDMDLVVSNSNDYAFVYKNNATELKPHNYVRVKLHGGLKNLNGIGSKVIVYAGGKEMMQEQYPSRGYQSSVDFILNFGVGTSTVVDSIKIVWPNNLLEVKRNVAVNRLVHVDIKDARDTVEYGQINNTTYFSPLNDSSVVHSENPFNDYTIQTLMINFLSREGPCIAAADVNGDGREDLFVGGAKGRRSKLYLQRTSNKFHLSKQPAFELDSMSEDVEAAFFDADGDQDVDLYVGSGGYEFTINDPLLQDRLYINDGNGRFVKKVDALPAFYTSTGAVAAADVDGDGDIDVFAGARVIPGRYPLGAPSQLLINDGQGKFSDGTNQYIPNLAQPNRITSAVWADINGDKKQELIVAGEWMPIRIFTFTGGRFEEVSNKFLRQNSTGWWNHLLAEDLDGDGDIDIVAGNHGRNAQYRASEKEPVSLLYKDFDGNGSIDPIFCYYVKGKSYPAASRDDLLEQLPALKKKFNDYSTYASATVKDLFTDEQLEGATELKAVMMETVYLRNEGGRFELTTLPVEAQYAPVHASVALDVNNDGRKDLLLAGNNSWTRVQFGRHLANHGMLFLGDERGTFNYVSQAKSGLNVRGDVRDLCVINSNNNETVVFGMNNTSAAFYTMNKNKQTKSVRR